MGILRFPFQRGETTLNRCEYRQVFANFLLSGNRVGPAHFIYGPMEDTDIIEQHMTHQR